MSESDAGLIPLESGDGAAVSLPADMVMPRDGSPVTPTTPEPVAPEPAPVTPEPVAPVAAEPVDPDDDAGLAAAEAELTKQANGDPQKAGILADLKATRQLVKQLKQQNKAGQAIAQKLMSRPDLVHLLETGQPIPAADVRALQSAAPVAPAVSVAPVDSAQDVADLELIAQTNGLYKQDGSGQLDLETAKRVRDFVKRTADAAVAERVKPLEQKVINADAQKSMGDAIAAADELGIDRTVSTRALTELYKENPAYLNDPQVVSTALLAAAGMDAIQRRRNAPPPPPPVRELVSPVVQPVVQERSTIPARPTLEVPKALKSVMSSHGISGKSVEGTLERLDKHTPGTNFVLED